MIDITTCNAILAVARSYDWRPLPEHLIADLEELANTDSLPFGARHAARIAIDHARRRSDGQGTRTNDPD